MAEQDDFTGRCWGGPMDGKWVTGEGPKLIVLRAPLTTRWWAKETPDPTDLLEPTYREHLYTWERVAWHVPWAGDPWECGFWCSSEPSEREHLEAHILGGLNAIILMSRWNPGGSTVGRSIVV